MNYRLSQKILFVLCLLSLVCIAGALLTNQMIFFYLCVGLFCGGFVQAYIFYRCPTCKKTSLRGVPFSAAVLIAPNSRSVSSGCQPPR